MPSLRMYGVVVASVLATVAGPAQASEPAAVRVSLPAPSGPHQIGTVSLHLVDRSRPDPWVRSQPYRELMVSAWYPAASTRGHRLAPYMAPEAAALFDTTRATDFEIPAGRVDWAGTRTHAYEGAPIDRRGGRRPVLVYSPGAGDPRTWGTALVEEMASRGYVVLTIDHTYESPAVRFPDGSVTGNEPVMAELRQAVQDGAVPAFLRKLLDVRVADARFLLDRLPFLPRGLSTVVDNRRVGFLGQSAGGILAAEGMYEDRRIAAGIDMDGTLEFNQEPNGTNLMPVAAHGLDRPFMLMGREGSDHTTEPSWRAFWAHSTGWRRDLTLRDARHQSYTDLESILPQTGLPREVVEQAIGTADPDRAVAAVRAHVASFFDRWLRGRDDHLLDGPSPLYPEIAFVG
ncbi:Tat pathway signal protein [Actinophytocola sp.]|uniref:alpha/beta hydrolase n=1 Tax=Actinophytocola sp. TaxID=1872138 RepID=UPI002ED0FD01